MTSLPSVKHQRWSGWKPRSVGLVFLVTILSGALASLLAYTAARADAEARAQRALSHAAAATAAMVENRLSADVQMLSATAALLAITPLNESQFQDYVERAALHAHYPALVELEYATFKRSIGRADSQPSPIRSPTPSLWVMPVSLVSEPSESSSATSATSSSVPSSRNEYATPAGRSVIDQVLATGVPGVSDPTVIYQKNSPASAGFLIVAPVSPPPRPVRAPPASAQIVRPADPYDPGIAGLVIGRFRSGVLLSDIIHHDTAGLVFSVRDAATASLVYTSGDVSACTARPAASPASVAGRTWIVAVCPLAPLLSVFDQTRPGVILAYDIALTLLIASVLSLLVSLRDRANRIALGMTRAFRSSENRLRDIADNLPVMIAYLTPDLTPTFLNLAYRRRLDTDATLGSPVLFHPHLLSHASRCLEGHLVRLEDESATGQVLDITLIPHTENHAIVGMYVMASDITDQKQTEASLFEEKERVSATLDSIGDAVIACNTDRIITHINPVACAMTGVRRDLALGRTVESIVDLVDPHSGAPQGLPVDDPSEARMGRPRLASSSVAVRRRDGHLCAVDFSHARIRDRSGRSAGTVFVLRDVSSAHAMAAQMAHQAHHDSLTGLPNRALLQLRLAAALDATQGPSETNGAMAFIDLDHFKDINDTLGHPVGDRVLRLIADRLLSEVPTTATVSRQGGDEFVLLLPGADRTTAAALCHRLMIRIEEPVSVDGRDLRVSASMGIAMYPIDGADPHALMKNADIALYHAKQAGRSTVSVFAPAMSERAANRIRMEHDLRHAIESGTELFLVYQPRLRRPNNDIVGMEALLRWRRPDGSLSWPSEFIPVAENSGLISRLDAWVMETACAQAVRWIEGGSPSLRVAVNVSIAGFDLDRIVEHVADALRRTGLPARHLELEFTETQMFADAARARQIIDQLKGLGVYVAIDDFGMGYSSLGYLAQYNFDTLKIDRSLIVDLAADQRQQAIVQAIMSLASALGCTVVAEGVETCQQQDLLDAYGPHDVQGYLHARPLGLEQATALLTARASTDALTSGGVIDPPV